MTTMKKTAQKSNKQKVTKKVVALSSGKHPGGRPTKYSQETIKVAREYLENYEEHGDQIVPRQRHVDQIARLPKR